MTSYLHVAPQYWPVIGGVQNYCTLLSEALTARGSSITVYSSQLSSRDKWQNDLPASQNISGVKVKRFSALRRGPVTWRLYHWCEKRYASRPKAVYELGLMLAVGPVSTRLPYAIVAHRHETSLVHLFGVYSAFVGEAFIAARVGRLPVVITPFIHTTSPIGLNMSWKRRILKMADHVVAMTPSEKTYLEREIGLRPQQVSVVSPGLRPTDYPTIEQSEARRRLGLPNEAFVALFIGRKELYKGIGTLFQAYRELQKNHKTQCRLILIGPDVDLASSVQEGEDEGIVDLGKVDHATKLLALNACDCLVLPSTSESFGIVILEAWAVAKPVVVTRLPSTQDIVTDNEDGLLFEMGDTVQLGEALYRLAADPTMAMDMGQNGQRRFFACYSSSVVAERVQRIYDSLAKTA